MTNTQEKAKVAFIDKIKTKRLETLAEEAEIEEPPPEPEKYGIKEMLEMIVFTESLGEVVLENLLDGISPFDIIPIVRDEDVVAQFGPAFSNLGDAKKEFVDLNAGEIRRLTKRIFEMGWNLFDAVTKGLTE